MDIAIGAAALSIITLVIVLILAARNKQKTEERKKDADIPPSSLAKDGDSHKPVD
ncbi:hypothetical protein PVV74_02895 [Roseovarius sp. SK2]|uniref:hypothetical protein n=1 Tax=Roseovarius TaxID=74030 RepID=UPI00237A8C79|nr:hypothetical protein [Roseovarius sp. SK2]MDD9724396.1 hypothetical protein [Roseovarius sp. SK2]